MIGRNHRCVDKDPGQGQDRTMFTFTGKMVVFRAAHPLWVMLRRGQLRADGGSIT